MKKFSEITAAQFTAMAWPTGKVIHVDGTNGSDTKAGRGKAVAFLTLTAAKTAAVSGDLIVVYPGTYAENNLLKNGVNWHFLAGATVDYTEPNTLTSPGYAIFDDRPTGACTCKITGHGNFTWRTPLVGYGPAFDEAPPNEAVQKGLMFIGTTASDIYFEADTLSFAHLSHDGATPKWVLWVTDGTVTVKCDKIIDLLYGISTQVDPGTFLESGCGGLFWGIGEMHFTFNSMKTTSYGIWPFQPTAYAGTANLWVTGDLIQSIGLNSSGVYISEAGGGASQNYRTWIVVKEIRVTAGSFAGYFLGSRGRHYLTAQKVSCGTGNGIEVAASGGGECWLNVQKVSSTASTLKLSASNTMIVNADINHIEDGTTGIKIDGGTLILRGGICKVTNGKGLSHTSGTSRIKNLIIDTTTTNNSANNPVSLSAAGCILDGCTLLAPALADSITGAFTVKIYGTTYANKAKNAGTTVQAGLGTLVADANVT